MKWEAEMSVVKSYAEINEKIKKRRAVVMTAEEVKAFIREQGTARAVEKVDVVTTGTFGAMCSSGAFLNFGHADPPLKMEKSRLWRSGLRWKSRPPMSISERPSVLTSLTIITAEHK
jgi:hypothetical protein